MVITGAAVLSAAFQGIDAETQCVSFLAAHLLLAGCRGGVTKKPSHRVAGISTRVFMLCEAAFDGRAQLWRLTGSGDNAFRPNRHITSISVFVVAPHHPRRRRTCR